LTPAEVLLDMLPRCAVVRLFFDADHPRVLVPDGLTGIQFIELGLNLPRPIVNLKVDEIGVSGTLSFSGRPFWCFVGREAVALICDARTGENQALDTDAYRKMAEAHRITIPRYAPVRPAVEDELRESRRALLARGFTLPGWFRGVAKGGVALIWRQIFGSPERVMSPPPNPQVRVVEHPPGRFVAQGKLYESYPYEALDRHWHDSLDKARARCVEWRNGWLESLKPAKVHPVD
jgi:hypothetical protein